MTSAWEEKAVFLAALELPDDQREAYLERVCPDDSARERIWTLLRHHEAVTQEILHAVPRSSPSAAPNEPDRIDEFRIIRRLGEGGMGVVYLAEDSVLGRSVALKVLAPGLIGSEDALARFRTEARSTAAIKHPGIVPVFKSGVDGGTHYIACEYVDGPTLAQTIESERGRRLGELTSSDFQSWCMRAADTIGAVGEALEAAHRSSIIHRDVKPSNILMDREHGPRLTDFGIAKHLNENDRTKQASLVGSCHYMSPEQASIAGTSVDQRTDIFSLGVVLYELVTLRRPFTGTNPSEILRAVAEVEPPRLRAVDARVPRDLEVICQKAIEKHPQNRYQTAAHMAADLRCFRRGDPILASPPSLARRMRMWVVRRRRPIFVTVCFVLFLLVVGSGWLIKTIKDGELAWVLLRSDRTPALAIWQRTNPVSYDLDSPAQEITNLSAPVRLPPGQYRITILDEQSGDFVEFNAVLTKPGRSNQIELVARDKASVADGQQGFSSPMKYGTYRSFQPDMSSEMVLVESGDYTVGWSEVHTEPSIRKRLVTLPAFYIDRHEVSIADYAAFAEAYGYPMPARIQNLVDRSQHDLPIVGLTMEQAEAYARWRGKRLPTYTEWQAATRGRDGRRYPWGDDWDRHPEFPTFPCEPNLAMRQTFDGSREFELSLAGLVPVHAPDLTMTSSGLLHAFDNARELTGSVEVDGRSVLVCGRSWPDSPSEFTLAHVVSIPIEPFVALSGFRCAKSARVPLPIP